MAPENCQHWHDLSEAEKRVIHDSRDYSIISIIDGMTAEERLKIYDSIAPNLQAGYNGLQKEWISDSRRELAWRKGKDVSEVSDKELVEDMERTGMRERYRLYWAGRKWLEGIFDSFSISNRASMESLELLTDYFMDLAQAYPNRKLSAAA